MVYQVPARKLVAPTRTVIMKQLFCAPVVQATETAECNQDIAEPGKGNFCFMILVDRSHQQPPQ